MVMLNAYSVSNINGPLNIFNFDFRSETSKFRGTIVITLLLTGMVTLVLTSAMGLIVTESSLPKPIKRLSYTLVHDRSKRNTVIWITFFFMCIATTLAVVRYRYVFHSVLPTLITYWVIWCESFGNQIRLIIKIFFYSVFFSFSKPQSR